MASKMAAKMEIPFIGDNLQGIFSKKISHFCYYAFWTSLRMYHANELFIIKDVLDKYTQQKQNNENMLSTTCLESKATDVS